MAYPLANNIAIPNATRLELTDFKEQRRIESDPDTVVAVVLTIELKSANATDRTYGKYLLTARNHGAEHGGPSDELRLRPAPEFLPGMVIQDVLQVRPGQLQIADALDQILDAWRSGNRNARKDNVLNRAGTIGMISQATLARQV